MNSLEGIRLKDFIENAIIDIDSALQAASKTTGSSYLYSNWTTQDGKWHINFELTVYSEKGNKSKWWWEIKVFWIWSCWIEGWLSNKNYTASKINFTICRKTDN